MLGTLLILLLQSAAVPSAAQQTCDVNTFVRAQTDKRTSLVAEQLALLEGMKGLVERRSALLDRKYELATMNPIKRGFKSTLDLNYSQKQIENLDRVILSKMDDIRMKARFLEIEFDILDRERDIFRLACLGTGNAPNR